MPRQLQNRVQRSESMASETAEWFRELAHETRISQQEHFRRALSEYRDKIVRTAVQEGR